MRIIVLGYMVRFPQGGMVWSNLQYLLGLKELGHDVYFVEDSDDYPCCYDPGRDEVGIDPTYGLRFAHESLRAIGCGERWAYHDAHRPGWLGPCAESILKVCASADLLLNLCGVSPLRPWLEAIPRKVLIDEDPAFTQVRNLSDPGRLAYSRKHDAFFTFAGNIGTANCTVPDDGIPWIPTRQPLVLRSILPAPPQVDGRFTSVLFWQSYDAPVFEGRRYGTKAHSFEPFAPLAREADEPLEMAVGGEHVPVQELRQAGWRVLDPRQLTVSVASYLDYIRASKAEFSVAKEGYVVSRSGWFSERSVTYLATGRPVVVQDTGFTDWLPAAEGVLAFRTPEEALRALRDVSGRYEWHCKAARAIAEEFFDSRQVLAQLLDTAFSVAVRKPSA
jgi:hypothetical protein